MGFVLMDVITETMGIGNLIPAAICDFHLNGATKGLLTSMVFFGIVFSSYIFGYLGDTKGRRYVIIWTLLFAKVFTFIAVFVQNVTIFMACRFITGIFLGGYSGVMWAYLGEFNTSKYRPAILSWVGVFIGVAYTGIPVIAHLLNGFEWRFALYSGYEFRPWRLGLIIYSIPGIIGGLLCIRLPESPKYLLSIRKNNEAYQAVEWIHKVNKGNKKHANFDIIALKTDEAGTGNDFKGLKGIVISLIDQTLPLIKPPYLFLFIACCALQFGTFFISAGLGLFLPDILNKLSKYRDETCDGGGECVYHVCDVAGFKFHQDKNITANNETCNDSVDSSVYENMIILGSVYICMYVVIAAVMNRERRKYIIAFTFILSSTFGFILPFVYNQMFITISFILTIISAGMNITLINGAACDIFPTYLRSMAVSVSMLVGRFGSTVSSNILGNLLDEYCYFTYNVCAIVALICVGMSFIVTK
ncbi:hypothetical protein ACKWTF_006954 [Chironomus riparius]